MDTHHANRRVNQRQEKFAMRSEEWLENNPEARGRGFVIGNTAARIRTNHAGSDQPLALVKEKKSLQPAMIPQPEKKKQLPAKHPVDDAPLDLTVSKKPNLPKPSATSRPPPPEAQSIAPPSREPEDVSVATKPGDDVSAASEKSEEVTSFRCCFCGLAFTSTEVLLEHIRIHTGDEDEEGKDSGEKESCEIQDQEGVEQDDVKDNAKSEQKNIQQSPRVSPDTVSGSLSSSNTWDKVSSHDVASPSFAGKHSKDEAVDKLGADQVHGADEASSSQIVTNVNQDTEHYQTTTCEADSTSDIPASLIRAKSKTPELGKSTSPVIQNSSRQSQGSLQGASTPGVVKYTCPLCHVDFGNHIKQQQHQLTCRPPTEKQLFMQAFSLSENLTCPSCKLKFSSPDARNSHHCHGKDTDVQGFNYMYSIADQITSHRHADIGAPMQNNESYLNMSGNSWTGVWDADSRPSSGRSTPESKKGRHCEGCDKSFEFSRNLSRHLQCNPTCRAVMVAKDPSSVKKGGYRFSFMKAKSLEAAQGTPDSSGPIQQGVTPQSWSPKGYICKQCGKSFQDGLKLGVHIRWGHRRLQPYVKPKVKKWKHHGLRKSLRNLTDAVISCRACQKTFKLESNLELHLTLKKKCRIQHEKLKNLEANSTNDNNSTSDMTEAGERDRPACKVCGHRYWSVWHLKKHMRAVHKNVPATGTRDKTDVDIGHLVCRKYYTCDSVPEAFKHMEQHNGIFLCTVCKHMFSQKKILYNHVLIHLKILPFKCILCDYKGRQVACILNHIKTNHLDVLQAENSSSKTTDSAKQAQPEQEQVLDLSSTSTAKVKKASPKRVTPKKVTPKKSLADKTKDREVGTVKNVDFVYAPRKTDDALLKETPDGWKCTECDAVYGSKSRTMCHIRKHTKARPYKCCYCNFTAGYSYMIYQHLRKFHFKNRPIKAPIIKNKGRGRGTILEQLENPKPGASNMSQKVPSTVPRLGNLPRNAMYYSSFFKALPVDKKYAPIRVGKDIWKCYACERSSNDPSVIRNHALSHTQLTPFHCLLCPFKTGILGKLISHLQDLHRVELQAHFGSNAQFEDFGHEDQDMETEPESDILDLHMTSDNSPEAGAGQQISRSSLGGAIQNMEMQQDDNTSADDTSRRRSSRGRQIKPQKTLEKDYIYDFTESESEKSAQPSKTGLLPSKDFPKDDEAMTFKVIMLPGSREKIYICPQCNFKSNYESVIQAHMAIKHSNGQLLSEFNATKPKPVPTRSSPKSGRGAVCGQASILEWIPHQWKGNASTETRPNISSTDTLVEQNDQIPDTWQMESQQSIVSGERLTVQISKQNDIIDTANTLYTYRAGPVEQSTNFDTEPRGGYRCSYCKERPRGKAAAISHQQEHTGEEPFCCDLCDIKEALRSKILTHIQELHMDQVVDIMEKKRRLTKAPSLICDESEANMESSELEDLPTSADDNLDSNFEDSTTDVDMNENFAEMVDAEMDLTNAIPVADMFGSAKPFNMKGIRKKNLSFYKQIIFVRGPKEEKLHIEQDKGTGRFLCPYCKKTFSGRNATKQHSRIHTHEKPYYCKLCYHNARNISSIMKHLQAQHKDDCRTRRGFSKISKASLAEVKKIRMHKQDTGDAVLAKTNQEPEEIDKEMEELHKNRKPDGDEQHMEEKGRPESPKMLQEFFKFQPGEVEKNLHLKTEMNGHCKCPFCNKMMLHSFNTKRHIRTHTGERPYSCNLCDYKGTQWGSVRFHLLKKHADVEKIAAFVAECDREYQDPELLPEEDEFVPEISAPSFEKNTEAAGRQEVSLSPFAQHAHTSTYDVSPGKKQWNAKWTGLYEYEPGPVEQQYRDIRRHVIYGSFKCPLCVKDHFREKGKLLSHLRSHSGEKPYRCNLCMYRAGQQSTIVHHVRNYHKLTEITLDNKKTYIPATKDSNTPDISKEAKMPDSCKETEIPYISKETKMPETDRPDSIEAKIADSCKETETLDSIETNIYDSSKETQLPHSSKEKQIPDNVSCMDVSDDLSRPSPDQDKKTQELTQEKIRTERVPSPPPSPKDDGKLWEYIPGDIEKGLTFIKDSVTDYSCPYCHKNKFNQIGPLKAHIRTHTMETPFHCKVCDYKCRQQSSMRYHLQKGHSAASGDQEHSAASGDQEHSAASADQGHSAASGDLATERYLAEDGVSTSMASDDLHGKNTDDPPRDLPEIVAEKEAATNEDDVDAQSKLDEDEFVDHTIIKSKHDDGTKDYGTYTFNCGKMEGRLQGQLNQLERDAITGQFLCCYCAQGTTTKYGYLVHVRLHTGEKPYRCKLCPHEAVQHSSIKYHVKHHHSKEEVDNFGKAAASGQDNIERGSLDGEEQESMDTDLPECIPRTSEESQKMNPHNIDKDQDQKDHDEENSNTLVKVLSTSSDITGADDAIKVQSEGPSVSDVPHTSHDAPQSFASDVPQTRHDAPQSETCHVPDQPDQSSSATANLPSLQKPYCFLPSKEDVNMLESYLAQHKTFTRDAARSLITFTIGMVERNLGYERDSSSDKFICPFCHNLFESLEAAKRHVRLHTGEKPYQCNICHRQEFKESKMIQHVVEKHKRKVIKAARKGVTGYQSELVPSKDAEGSDTETEAEVKQVRACISQFVTYSVADNHLICYTCDLCLHKIVGYQQILVHLRRYHMVDLRGVDPEKDQEKLTISQSKSVSLPVLRNQNIPADTNAAAVSQQQKSQEAFDGNTTGAAKTNTTLFSVDKMQNLVVIGQQEKSANKSFVCNKCGHTTDNQSDMMSHIGGAHPEAVLYVNPANSQGAALPAAPVGSPPVSPSIASTVAMPAAPSGAPIVSTPVARPIVPSADPLVALAPSVAPPNAQLDAPPVAPHDSVAVESPIAPSTAEPEALCQGPSAASSVSRGDAPSIAVPIAGPSSPSLDIPPVVQPKTQDASNSNQATVNSEKYSADISGEPKAIQEEMTETVGKDGNLQCDRVNHEKSQEIADSDRARRNEPRKIVTTNVRKYMSLREPKATQEDGSETVNKDKNLQSDGVNLEKLQGMTDSERSSKNELKMIATMNVQKHMTLRKRKTPLSDEDAEKLGTIKPGDVKTSTEDLNQTSGLTHDVLSKDDSDEEGRLVIDLKESSMKGLVADKEPHPELSPTDHNYARLKSIVGKRNKDAVNMAADVTEPPGPSEYNDLVSSTLSPKRMMKRRRSTRRLSSEVMNNQNEDASGDTNRKDGDQPASIPEEDGGASVPGTVEPADMSSQLSLPFALTLTKYGNMVESIASSDQPASECSSMTDKVEDLPNDGVDETCITNYFTRIIGNAERTLARNIQRDKTTGYYLCPYCDKSARLLQTTKIHMRLHTGEKPYECKLCDVKTVQHCSIIMHIKNYHPEFLGITPKETKKGRKRKTRKGAVVSEEEESPNVVALKLGNRVKKLGSTSPMKTNYKKVSKKLKMAEEEESPVDLQRSQQILAAAKQPEKKDLKEKSKSPSVKGNSGADLVLRSDGISGLKRFAQIPIPKLGVANLTQEFLKVAMEKTEPSTEQLRRPTRSSANKVQAHNQNEASTSGALDLSVHRPKKSPSIEQASLSTTPKKNPCVEQTHPSVEQANLASTQNAEINDAVGRSDNKKESSSEVAMDSDMKRQKRKLKRKKGKKMKKAKMLKLDAEAGIQPKIINMEPQIEPGFDASLVSGYNKMKKKIGRSKQDSLEKYYRIEIGPIEKSLKFERDPVTHRTKCPYCSMTLSHMWSTYNHVRLHTGEKPFICNLCDYKSVQLTSMKTHLNKAHQDAIKADSQNSANLPLESNSNTNNSNGNNSALQNSLVDSPTVTSAVDSTMTSIDAIKKSVASSSDVTNPGSFNVYNCFSFVEPEGIQTQQFKKDPKTGLMACPQCEAAIPRRGLMEHICSHTGDLPYRCKLCTHKTAKRSAIIRHIQMYHREDAFSKFVPHPEEESQGAGLNGGKDQKVTRNKKLKKKNKLKVVLGYKKSNKAASSEILQKTNKVASSELMQKTNKAASVEIQQKTNKAASVEIQQKSNKAASSEIMQKSNKAASSEIMQKSNKAASTEIMQSNKKDDLAGDIVGEPMKMLDSSRLGDFYSLSISKKEKYLVIQRVKNGMFACPFCPSEFLRTADVKRHSRGHTGDRPYKCRLCGKTTRQQDGMRKHIDKMHAAEVKASSTSKANQATMSTEFCDFGAPALKNTEASQLAEDISANFCEISGSLEKGTSNIDKISGVVKETEVATAKQTTAETSDDVTESFEDITTKFSKTPGSPKETTEEAYKASMSMGDKIEKIAGFIENTNVLLSAIESSSTTVSASESSNVTVSEGEPQKLVIGKNVKLSDENFSKEDVNMNNVNMHNVSINKQENDDKSSKLEEAEKEDNTSSELLKPDSQTSGHIYTSAQDLSIPKRSTNDDVSQSGVYTDKPAKLDKGNNNVVSQSSVSTDKLAKFDNQEPMFSEDIESEIEVARKPIEDILEELLTDVDDNQTGDEVQHASESTGGKGKFGQQEAQNLTIKKQGNSNVKDTGGDEEKMDIDAEKNSEGMIVDDKQSESNEGCCIEQLEAHLPSADDDGSRLQSSIKADVKGDKTMKPESVPKKSKVPMKPESVPKMSKVPMKPESVPKMSKVPIKPESVPKKSSKTSRKVNDVPEVDEYTFEDDPPYDYQPKLLFSKLTSPGKQREMGPRPSEKPSSKYAANKSDQTMSSPIPSKYSTSKGHGSKLHYTYDPCDEDTMNVISEENSSMYKCPHCTYRHRIKSVVRVHIRIHTGFKPYTCHYCEFTSTHFATVRRHLWKQHKIGEEPTSKSSESDAHHSKTGESVHFKFSPSDEEKDLVFKRADDKSAFLCSYCNRPFTTEGNLRIHIRTHTGDKPYHCRYCEFRTAYGFLMQKHINMAHKDQHGSVPVDDGKPTMGQDYAFNPSEVEINRVLRRSPGSDMYKCEVCGRGSVLECDAVAHMRTHTGDTPYSCAYCDTQTKTQVQIVKHVNDMHKPSPKKNK